MCFGQNVFGGYTFVQVPKEGTITGKNVDRNTGIVHGGCLFLSVIGSGGSMCVLLNQVHGVRRTRIGK